MRMTLLKEQIQEIGQDNHGCEENGQTDVTFLRYLKHGLPHMTGSFKAF